MCMRRDEVKSSYKAIQLVWNWSAMKTHMHPETWRLSKTEMMNRASLYAAVFSLKYSNTIVWNLIEWMRNGSLTILTTSEISSGGIRNSFMLVMKSANISKGKTWRTSKNSVPRMYFLKMNFLSSMRFPSSSCIAVLAFARISRKNSP